MPKFPKEYKEVDIPDPDEIYQPRQIFDSRARLIMPMTPYQKNILKTTPGSKNVSQTSEDYDSGPQTNPDTIKSGYLYSGTQFKAGTKNGWISRMAGGDSSYPFLYYNESTGEKKFYVDNEGNVYIDGVIQVGGAAADVNSGTTLIQAGKVLISGSTNLSDWSSDSDATYIDGGQIYTGSVTTNEVNFTVVDTGNVVGTINSSTEGIDINGDTISLNGNTVVGGTFTVTASDNISDVASGADVTANNAQSVSWLTDGGNLATYDLVESAMEDETIIVGGYINTSYLTADNINTGTLTGRTVQTDSSGLRLKMHYVSADYAGYLDFMSGNEILTRWKAVSLFPSAGGVVAELTEANAISGTTSKLDISWSGSDLYPGSAWFKLRNDILGLYYDNATGKTIVYGTNIDIGRSGDKFKNLYLSGNIYVSGTVDGTDISAHVGSASAHHTKYSDSDARSAITAAGIPGTIYPSSSTYDLGSSTYPWDNVYCADIYGSGGDRIADLSGGLFDMWQPLTLRSLSSPPSGVADGTIYYNTTDEQIKGKAGGSWYTL